MITLARLGKREHQTATTGVGLLGTMCLIAAAFLASQTILVAFLAGFLITRLARPLRHPIPALWLPIGFVALAALINSVKWPESDLAAYYDYIDVVRRSPILETMTATEPFLSIRPTEFTFKAYILSITLIGGLSHICFSLISTSLIYGVSLWTCYVLLVPAGNLGYETTGDRARPYISVALTAALCAGLTFSLTGHLVRQYLAGALFIAGFVHFAVSGKKRGFALVALAATVHVSSLMLLVPLLLTMVARRSVPAFIVCLAAVVSVTALPAVESALDLSSSLSMQRNDGQQPAILVAIDAIIVTLTAVLVRFGEAVGGKNKAALRELLFFAVAVAALLFSVRAAPFLFFRLYMYGEFLRTIFLAALFHGLIRRSGELRPAVAVSLLVIGSAAFAVRTASSAWSYFDDPSEPKSLSMVSVIDRWARIELR